MDELIIPLQYRFVLSSKTLDGNYLKKLEINRLKHILKFSIFIAISDGKVNAYNFFELLKSGQKDSLKLELFDGNGSVLREEHFINLECLSATERYDYVCSDPVVLDLEVKYTHSEVRPQEQFSHDSL